MKLLALLLLTIALSCTGGNIRDGQQASEPLHRNDVTIIIQNHSGNPLFVWKEPSFQQADAFEISSTVLTDTIAFPIDLYEYIYIGHKGVIGDTLLCARGDTININAAPTDMNFQHISQNDTLLNFHSSYRKFIESHTWSSTEKRIDSLHEAVLPSIQGVRPMVSESDRQRLVSHAVIHPRQHKPDLNLLTELLTLRERQYTAEQTFVYDFGQKTSNSLARAFKERLKFDYNDRLNNYRIFFPNEVPDSLFATVEFTNQLLEVPYARKYIQSYLYQNVIMPLQRSSLPNHIPDYKIAYEQIPADWPDSLTKFARYISLEMMVETDESFKAVRQYYDDFSGRYPNDRLAKLLEERYLFDLEQYRSVSSDLQLIDDQHHVYPFETILDGLQGSLVYVDFWASWCVPCREAMPDSKQLAQQYDGKVKFVYLSLDKDADQWRVASNAEGLNTYQHSYLIVNADSAQLLKQLNMESIPRYLIYDRNGDLIHQNAPGPRQNEIRETFDNYLSL